jgi:multisubunit Na+/H+ antiporter MnhF subunit
MSTPDDEDERTPSFRQSVGDALRKSGFGQVAPGEVPTARSLLAAIGGVRGLIESILPGLGFLVIYSFTRNLPLAVLAPVGLAVIFVIVRLVTRSPLSQAVVGIVGIGVSAALAILSGRAENNFVPGIVINIVSLVGLIGSIILRWPLIGVIVGFLTNEGFEWRANKAKRRVLYFATWLWAGLFAVRLIVEVPLYLAGETEWLAAMKLVLGVPLYAGLLWVTWLLVRAVYGRADEARAD